MVASRRNRTLFISDGSRSVSCQGALLQHGARLNQVLIASEVLCGNHPAWNEVAEDEVVGVDGQLMLHRWRISELAVTAEPFAGSTHPGSEQLRGPAPERLSV
jgi:glutamine amidotransferase